MSYKPPFIITNKMLEYISSIMEKIGRIDNYTNLNKMPLLRRNKIKSIHSSLAIEANSLSLNEVKDVINGKVILGQKEEIQEVKNAYKAYEMINDWNPYSLKDLKKAHGVMTHFILEESGKFRKGREGVFDDQGICIHVCPPPNHLDELMNNLFGWMKKNKDQIHPLILSSVFHYEFVFIHPFSDGNGRTARLWQNVILSHWKKIFEYIPVESQILKYQNEYYDVIDECNKNGESTLFIEFMLNMFDDVLDDFIKNTTLALTNDAINITKLLEVMEVNIPMTAYEIMDKLKIKSKETLRKTYLNPAMKEGLIRQTNPEKRTSKKQMYYKIGIE